ncbi:hypothetical protein OH77DRAFT_1594191 [Trametes cingulata]|nr:hypothetical protein OH77DRAFT_1594191 [Trametes cingulata]
MVYRASRGNAIMRTHCKFAKPWKPRSAEAARTTSIECSNSDLWGLATLLMLVPVVRVGSEDRTCCPCDDLTLRKLCGTTRAYYEKRYCEATVTYFRSAEGRCMYSPTRSEVTDSACGSDELPGHLQELGNPDADGVSLEADGRDATGLRDFADGIAYTSSDYAAQRHLLHTALDPVPLIPLLCIADEADIVPLMCSSLYQRRTVGVDTPVLGVAYSPENQVFRVLLGWFTHATTRADRERSWMTIALPPSDATSPSDGVFDLRSPLHARAFLTFLEQSFSRLLDSMADTQHAGHSGAKLTGPGGCDMTQPVEALSIWRADTVYEAVCNVPPEQGGMRLHMWRKEINELDLKQDFSWARQLAIEEACRRDMTRQRLAWPAAPCEWLLEAKLTRDVSFKYPGICEWSLDHRVLTLAFLPDGETYKRHQPYISKLFAMLHPLGNFLSEGCQCLLNCSSCSATINHKPSQAAYRLLENQSIHGLVTMVSGAVIMERARCIPSRSAPDFQEAWEDVADWFWAIRHDIPKLTTETAYLSSGRVHYPRSAEYDSVVHVHAETGSAMASTSSEVPSGGTAASATTPSYFPYDSIYALISQNMELGNEDEWVMRRKTPDRTCRQQEVITELGQIEPSSYAAIAAIDNLKEHADLNPPKSLLHVRRRMIQQMKDRLLKYPLSGEHGAVTIPLAGYFAELSNWLGDAAARELQNTLPAIDYGHCGEATSCSTVPGYPKDVAGGSIDEPLHLPVLLITFQSVGDALDNSTRNRQRMACTGAVRFLLALGVADFPIYGLSVCGPYGTLCMAWYSSQDECCYIVDRNTASHRFELTEERGVLRYVAFLAEIEEHGRELRRRVEAAKPELIKKTRTEAGRASLRWTLRSQLDDYGLWPEKQWEDEYQ